MVEGGLAKHKNFSPRKNLAMNLRPVRQIAATSTLTFPVSSTIKVTFQKHEISYLATVRLCYLELKVFQLEGTTNAIYLQARFANKAQFETPKA